MCPLRSFFKYDWKLGSCLPNYAIVLMNAYLNFYELLIGLADGVPSVVDDPLNIK